MCEEEQRTDLLSEDWLRYPVMVTGGRAVGRGEQQDPGRASLTPRLRPLRAGGWSPGVGTGTELKVDTFHMLRLRFGSWFTEK